MPYLNDTGTLAEAISPAYVAAQAGQTNQIEQEKSGLANAVSQMQAPADVQKPFLANEATQANTAQTQANTQKTSLENLFTQQTQPGKIGAENAGNQLKVTQDQVQKLQTLGGYATQLAGVMDSVPPPARPAMMKQILDQQGIDSSQLPQQLLTGDPDVLRHVAQSIVQMGPQFQTESMKATTEAGSREAVASTEGGYHLAGQQVIANARKYASDNQLEMKKISEGLDQAVVQLGNKINAQAKAGQQPDPNDLALMKMLQEQSIKQHQLMATNTAQLVGLGIPQVPTYTPQVGGGSNQGTPQVPTSGPSTGGGGQLSDDQMQSAAKQVWPNDDPTKYQYRQGPDGSLQRKPK